jgi:predicted transcriptional regulator
MATYTLTPRTLRIIRNILGLSQQDLAMMVCVDRTVIGKFMYKNH